MQSLINLKRVPIGELFDFPKTNSKITKRFCNTHKGSIPVYASSRDENSTLGFIEDNLKGVNYYSNCLSWNRNGSVGYVFIRNHKFATNEDHRALVIKKELRDKLDKLYLKFEIERQLFLNGFSFLNKCGVDKIKEINILIPINKEGEFDLEKQKDFAGKYELSQRFRLELENLFENIVNLNIEFNTKYKTKSVFVTDIFEVKKGDSRITKRYINENSGEYPVYSSQTTEEGEIGKINTYDYPTKKEQERGIENKECFTWTSDGINAGTVFYRKGKFSITTHCGILDLKKEFKERLNFEYLFFILNITLPNYTLGEWANKRIGVERLSEVPLEIPINVDGEFDLEKQKEISKRYKMIEEIKDKLREDYVEIANSKIQLMKE